MQADEKIILAIADLDVPLIMGSRLKKLIKAIQEAAKSSWDWKREGAKKTRMLSYHLKNWSAWWYKLRIPAKENAGETVVSRLERQLSKHHIGGKHPDTKARRGKTAETRIKRTKLGNNTELVERGEPEQRQPRTITAEAYLDAFWDIHPRPG